MKKEISMRSTLLDLSTLVNSCYLIEEVLSESLYQAIEQLICQEMNVNYPERKWQTIRWDVCANFEYKEIWFAPTAWSLDADTSQNLNIEQCYAYFKVTIQNHDRIETLIDDDFDNNGNRLPTVNFFNHINGFVSIQFHLNKNMIKTQYSKETNYLSLRNWVKSKNRLMQEYDELEKLGFHLSKALGCWYMPIGILDSMQVAQDFEYKVFDRSLDPIRDALKKLYPALEIFDLIQKQAKLII